MPSLITENSRQAYSARECGRRTMDAVMLPFHIKALHGDINKYKCPHWSHLSLAFDEISIHMKCNRELQFKCRLCSRASDKKQENAPLIVKAKCITAKMLKGGVLLASIFLI